ncbi:MAG TPA: hypothetical protein DEP91_12225 [Sphingomonas bacterium]|jgi:flagellar motor protein MotB|uniref:OmpA-like domain-containing protein n=1 Tax=Sphingomonas bacterium TaxID=1895847 RepID=A0A3D0WE06_9SPHN|nr:hypothetical protein [Sphingomonas bacterium]
MSARGVRRSRAEEEEESYFISMADMMVGLLFVFIILLLYFALQFQQKSKALSDAGEARAQLLTELKREIERSDRTLKVTIDPVTGVLTLPAAVLFAKGDDRLSAGGQAAVAAVGRAMARVLPCYTLPRRSAGCSYVTERSIDAIFIEGHTDSDPFTGNGRIGDNLDLSAFRAANTFRQLRTLDLGLDGLRNSAGQPILSVSGYGEARPVPNNPGLSEAQKSLNRRIDLRFLMDTPKADNLGDLLTRQQ